MNFFVMLPSEEVMVIKYIPVFKFETSISFEARFFDELTILPLISEIETESKLLVAD
jgi:hypothetical protein